jgi:hypothetical protein
MGLTSPSARSALPSLQQSIGQHALMVRYGSERVPDKLHTVTASQSAAHVRLQAGSVCVNLSLHVHRLDAHCCLVPRRCLPATGCFPHRMSSTRSTVVRAGREAVQPQQLLHRVSGGRRAAVGPRVSDISRHEQQHHLRWGDSEFYNPGGSGLPRRGEWDKRLVAVHHLIQGPAQLLLRQRANELQVLESGPGVVRLSFGP